MSRALALALLASAACLEAAPGEPPAGMADAAAASDAAIDAAPVATANTCATILEASPGEASGLDMIDPDGEGGAAPFQVYCDMAIEGGGWMLVARSAGAENNHPFGWLHDDGVVSDGSIPYSLSVDRPGLVFTELLVGSRGAEKGWGANVYRIALPDGFVTGYEALAADAEPVTVLGGCDPVGGPAMLRFVGHTDAVGHFFLRDMTADQNFGLFPSGFALSGEECGTSGNLHGEHGMIFVR